MGFESIIEKEEVQQHNNRKQQRNPPTSNTTLLLPPRDGNHRIHSRTNEESEKKDASRGETKETGGVQRDLVHSGEHRRQQCIDEQ